MEFALGTEGLPGAALHFGGVRGFSLLFNALAKAGFNPDQPRDDYDRWADTGSQGPAPDQQLPNVIAAAGAQSAAYCWNQMQIDKTLCASLRPTSVVAACRSQAMELYSACLTGKAIPPLPF
jgi:hypothetical protein